jgi:flagellar protein FlbD
VITLHKLNGTEFVINAELIEALEPGAQTCVVLATGNRFIVTESAQEVQDRIIEYRQKVAAAGKVVNPIAGYKRENP